MAHGRFETAKREKPEIKILGQTAKAAAVWPGSLELEVDSGENRRTWLADKSGNVLKKQIGASPVDYRIFLFGRHGWESESVLDQNRIKTQRADKEGVRNTVDDLLTNANTDNLSQEDLHENLDDSDVTDEDRYDCELISATVQRYTPPNFETAKGNCEVPRCPNPAKYRAIWPHASELVCENHKKGVADKAWPDVACLFGSKPPK